MRFLMLLLPMLFLCNCQHIVDLPDLCPKITLPASGDGAEVCTVSKKRRRIPKVEWDEQRKKMIHFDVKDYTKMKRAFLKHCLSSKCKQQIGQYDKLFEAIDKAAGAASGLFRN